MNILDKPPLLNVLEYLNIYIVQILFSFKYKKHLQRCLNSKFRCREGPADLKVRGSVREHDCDSLHVNACSVNHTWTRKLDYGSRWLGWFWDAEEQGLGADLFELQRQRRSVKDGSIVGLILQKRTWIKQTWYGLFNSLHPLLRAVAAFQSRPLDWETIHSSQLRNLFREFQICVM